MFEALQNLLYTTRKYTHTHSLQLSLVHSLCKVGHIVGYFRKNCSLKHQLHIVHEQDDLKLCCTL